VKVYLAGERDVMAKDANAWEGQGYQGRLLAQMRRRLFSYYYHGFEASKWGSDLSPHVEHSHASGLDLFLDSGAFTAFTKKTTIPIERYAEYVKKYRHIWTVCSSLDAIGQGEAAARESYENFAKLVELGADVCPVWHVREPEHWLQRYVDEGWPYIFIGGMVPETTKWLKERLDHVWHRVLTNEDGTPKVKTHGFGLTDQLLMFRYPWWSVDSTSWLMTGIFGACLFRVNGRLRKVVFSDESPEAKRWSGWHYGNLDKETQRVVDGWLEPFGVTAQECASHYSFRDIVNAGVFQNLEDMGSMRFLPEQITLF
jgi:hypothetical protein